MLLYPALILVLLLSLHAPVSAQAAAQLPLQKGHVQVVHELKWSPNDKLLLTYSAADGFMHIWRMPEGWLLTSIEASAIKTKLSEKSALRAFAWSPDSRLIASGSENGTAQIWDAESGKLLWSTRVAEQFVTGVSFSRDGKYVAAIASPEDEPHKLFLLDAANGQIVKQLGVIERKFLTYYHDSKLAFSDDNKQLFVGDIGGTVTRWDLQTGALISKRSLRFCQGKGRIPKAFAYSDDVSLAIARCGSQTDVIDTQTGSIVQQKATDADQASIVLSKDNQLLALGDSGSSKLFNLGKGSEETIDSYFPITCGCEFNNDASLLAMQDYFDGPSVKIIDLKTKKTAARIEAHPGKIRALAFSSDGKFVASGSDDRTVRLWDAQTGALVHTLPGPTRRVDAVAFTPDSKLVAAASDDQRLNVWEVATGKLKRSIQLSTEGVDGVSSIAFSPDGERMVTTRGATVTVWDVSDWSLFRVSKTPEIQTFGELGECCTHAEDARFDTRGALIVAAYGNGTIKVWNPNPTGPRGKQLISAFKASEETESFALSADGKLLVINDGEKAPRIWSWPNRKSLRSLGEDASYVHKVVFSPDSRFIATSDVGGEIYLWSAATGKLIRKFKNGYSSNDALAFSPDGTRLVSGGENQNIIMLDVKTGVPLWNILPIRELQPLTPAEVAELKQAATVAAVEAETAANDTRQLSKQISISFSHFGVRRDPSQTRLAETGRPVTSLMRQEERTATGIWLRLHNNSRLPVYVWTESVYLPTNNNCGYQTNTGKFFAGMCESSEIGIRFTLLDAKGKALQYGLDVGGISMLPPNTSVLFDVPKDLLREGRSIAIRYQFQNADGKGKLVDYGKERELRLTQRDVRRLQSAQSKRRN